ncbi:hypothetical protein O4H53_25105 [Sulfitobacter sp. G21635-S1]|uniref:hypothetical protein n=1 Tax=Sulfitobacter sp. G21635-S1 TaxID=3014043 RepID=UPI0022B04468|nr:hypothetical protein [Sulfitobacter sp. G21635-S1]MCZ4258835.1 hypothetical protein [Sulfitobacter sp. G21635-S1]
MKKLSAKQRERNRRIQLFRERAYIRRRYFTYITDELYTVKFPKIFSLSRNYSGTIEAISKIKEIGHSYTVKPLKIEIDLTDVEDAALAAVLVLSSEIDRVLSLERPRNRQLRIVPKNLMDWDLKVAAKLDDLGFFSLFGINFDLAFPDNLFTDEFSLLKMRVGFSFQPERIGKLINELHGVADFFNHSSYVYDAMVEATLNVNDHAYPETETYRFRAFIGAWWAAASYSAEKKEIRFVVIDQGVGIPQTLPKWTLWEELREKLSVGAVTSQIVKQDARMIAAAIEVSRTSKNRENGRGQGLADVLSPVSQTSGGRVRILSGSGEMLYRRDGDMELKELSRHVGGTLIEWCLPADPRIGDNQNE